MRAHYIRENATTRVPSRYIALAVDTCASPESAEGVRTEYLHAWYSSRWVYRRGRHGDATADIGMDADSWWDTLDSHTQRGHPTWVWCDHLVQAMTLLGLWQRVDDGRYRLERYIASDAMAIITISSGLGRVHLMDRRNYWRTPQPGEMIIDERVEDLAFDVRSLADLVVREQLGVLQKTVGAMALSNYRHCHMQHKLLHHGCKPVTELESAALFGGQVVVSYHGMIDEPIYCVDVTSAYSSAMRNHEYPVKLVRYYDTMPLDSLRVLTRAVDVIASVLVCTTTSTYPVRVGHTVQYATGTYWTTLCGHELRLAVSCGHVRAVGHVAIYESRPVFASYVDYWYARRMEYRFAGQQSWEHVAKLMLNSLHGKFGQRSRRWVGAPDEPVVTDHGRWARIDSASGELHEYRSVCGVVQEHERIGFVIHAIPAITAHVHAYVREHMRTLRALCPPQSILYQDTDSLHLTQAGYDAIRHLIVTLDHQPGDLRLVGTYHHGIYRGCRDYTLDDLSCLAGMPLSAIQVGDGRMAYDVPESADAIVAGSPRNGVKVKRVVVDRPLHSIYGTVHPSGWVTPPHIDQPELR